MTNSKTPDLKPCPFCGGEAQYNQFLTSDDGQQAMTYHEIECLKCGANIHDGSDFETAVKEWNTRHNPAADKIRAEIERAVNKSKGISVTRIPSKSVIKSYIIGLNFALAALEGEG